MAHYRITVYDYELNVQEKHLTQKATTALEIFAKAVNNTEYDGLRYTASLCKNGNLVAAHHFKAAPQDLQHYWRGRIDQVSLRQASGRPPTITNVKRINVYLDEESLERAIAIGSGNISEGIRVALKSQIARQHRS